MGRQPPACRARPAPCRPTIALAVDRVEAAIRGQVPVGVVGCDAWSRAEDVGRVLARRRPAWRRRLHTNRGLEPASVPRRARNGGALPRPGPPIAVEALGPLRPAQAYRPIHVGAPTSWGFTRGGRLPRLGTVRRVVSVEPAALPGRSVLWVTHRVQGRAATLSRVSLQRWPTDTFDQDRQGPLGCNAYRRRRLEAMGTQWWMVFVASSRRHVTRWPAGPDRPQGLLHPIGDACRQPGRARLHRLWVVVPDQWSHGATVDHRCAPLCATPRGMAPVCSTCLPHITTAEFLIRIEIF
jgi:hypothetical protein